MKNYGFTLAEVLITLMILGTIAVIVIPNAIQKANDRATVVRVKKTYSSVLRALNMAIAENGPIHQWDWPVNANFDTTKNHVYCANIFAQYINTQKKCFDDNTTGACAKHYMYSLEDGQKLRSTYQYNVFKGAIILQDGTTLECFPQYSTTETQYGNINLVIDVNGPAPPNRNGYDIFDFYLNSKGFVRSMASRCTIVNPASPNGQACIDWVIKHNNLDYKYRDVTSEW